MIQTTRSLAHQLRAVFRLALQISTSSSMTPVMFQAGRDGLHVAAQSASATAIYHMSAKALVDETVVVPFQSLADCEGKNNSPLTLETNGKNQVLFSWRDGAVGQTIQVAAKDGFKLPPLPTKWDENEPRLLDALREASQTASGDSIRYAIDHIQLRGDGMVVSTDGHQLLVQTGFAFPGNVEAMVPALKLFGSKALPQDTPILVGKTEKSTALRIGAWTFLWRMPAGRFPIVGGLIDTKNVTTTLRLSDSDAQCLADNLLRLPQPGENELAVTLDLNGPIAVRAKGENQTEPTELCLTDSAVEGESLVINTDRTFLHRAIQLGFREFRLFGGDDARVLCQDASRTYVWMQLDRAGAVARGDGATRVESRAADEATSVHTETEPQPAQEEPQMPRTKRPVSNGQPIEETRWQTTEAEQPVLAQAEALRDSLRDLTLKANDLIGALKRQRRQTKLVQETLASLKQLQSVAG